MAAASHRRGRGAQGLMQERNQVCYSRGSGSWLSHWLSQINELQGKDVNARSGPVDIHSTIGLYTVVPAGCFPDTQAAPHPNTFRSCRVVSRGQCHLTVLSPTAAIKEQAPLVRWRCSAWTVVGGVPGKTLLQRGCCSRPGRTTTSHQGILA